MKNKYNLPTLKLTFFERNPDWKAKRDKGLDNYYSEQEFQCEVLTIHLEKNTMRVRYRHLGEKRIRNMEATPFFEQYEIRRTKIG